VAIVARTLTLDLTTLPVHSPELQVGFEIGAGNNRSPILIVFPGTDASLEPQHVRYAVYLDLKLGDDRSSGLLGQLLVTGERIIGMMTHGSVGDSRLNESAGTVFAFTIGWDDIQPATTKTRWTGRVAGVIIRSAGGQNPAFELTVTSVVGTVADSGAVGYAQSFADLVASLTPESRIRLQRPTEG